MTILCNFITHTNNDRIESKVGAETTQAARELETAMKIKFIKEKLEEGEFIVITEEFMFKSKNTAVLNKRDVRKTLKDQREDILEQINAFISNGSDWHIDKIIAFYANIRKYQPLRGSLYIYLPAYMYLKNKRAIVNVQNKNQECIKWCLRAALGIYND